MTHPTKQNGFLPLSSILKDHLAGLAKGQFRSLWEVERHWKDIVGQMVAQNSRVLTLKNGVLHVGVSHSTWLHELGFMKTAILEQLKTKLPESGVTEIKWRLEK